MHLPTSRNALHSYRMDDTMLKDAGNAFGSQTKTAPKIRSPEPFCIGPGQREREASARTFSVHEALFHGLLSVAGMLLIPIWKWPIFWIAVRVATPVNNIDQAWRSNMAMRTLTAVLHREEDLYVAECPEVGTVSQGQSIEEAVANLKEATELYLEEFPLREVSRPLLTTFEVANA